MMEAKSINMEARQTTTIGMRKSQYVLTVVIDVPLSLSADSKPFFDVGTHLPEGKM